MDEPLNRSRLLRALMKTFPLGRLFNFEIRIHWTIFIYFLVALRWYEPDGGTSNGKTALIAFICVLLLFTIVTIHELGHAFAARRRGIEVNSITLSPIGGAAWMGRSPSPHDELFVVACGPAVHPVMLLIGALPYFMLQSGSLDLGYYGNHLLYQFFWLNVVLLAFNMLPTFPLDGGRILRACLALRMDASRATLIAATVGKIASVVLIFAGIIGYGEFWLIWIAIGVSNFFTCQQELMMAREDSPYAEPSWAYGGGFTPSDDSYLNSDREERPGPIRRFLESRSERQQARVAAEEEEMKQRVDDLLGKVSQVGMDGLTEEERSFLQEASDRYKKT